MKPKSHNLISNMNICINRLIVSMIGYDVKDRTWDEERGCCIPDRAVGPSQV